MQIKPVMRYHFIPVIKKIRAQQIVFLTSSPHDSDACASVRNTALQVGKGLPQPKVTVPAEPQSQPFPNSQKHLGCRKGSPERPKQSQPAKSRLRSASSSHATRCSTERFTHFILTTMLGARYSSQPHFSDAFTRVKRDHLLIHG